MEGFLLFDKPAGMTSHDVVDVVRRITHERTVGHAGTLDPFATGLLLIGVGRAATKRFSEFAGLDKEYLATIRLGATSDTGDLTGAITPVDTRAAECRTARDEHGNYAECSLTHSPHYPLANIDALLTSFLGPQMQTPPMYSAKKIGGKKLYELARAGQTVERSPVPVTVYELELLDPSPGLRMTTEGGMSPLEATTELNIRTRVSSGTYIRTLGEDIGKKLGCGGYLTALRRTKIGSYDVKNAITLENLKKPGAALPFFMPS